MRITPVCFDSMGVRSMCTLVETDVRIVIDPSAALGPSRYGLPPHELEYMALDFYKNRIHEISQNADAIVISHYHYDHYDPNETFYENKVLFMKHPTEKINKSQKRRAELFLKKISEFNIADGNEYMMKNTKIEFSEPVKHGDERSKLGYVVMTLIEYKGKRFIHTSDVQGPGTKKAADWIIEKSPDVLFLGGPATYMKGWRISEKTIQHSLENCIEILKNTEPEIFVLDHHILRDKNYKRYFEIIEDKTGVEPITSAEFLGEKNLQLEALRQELFAGKRPENYENFIYTK